MKRHVTVAIALGSILTGCAKEQPPPAAAATQTDTRTTTEVSAADLPEGVVSVVTASEPGIKITGAERKERDGRVYFDVEGERADGSEVELDVLSEGDGFKVVEIQRDIAWIDAPEYARAAAATSSRPFEPVRVIESRQTDGTVVYELFAEGAPAKPALEVRVADGKAEVLKEEWPH